MNEQLKQDLLHLETLLEKVKSQGLDYLNNLDSRPTSTGKTIRIIDNLFDQGLGTLGALQEFNERFEAIMVSSSGPRYWGYVTGGTTPASIAGDWLSSIYDQNSQATKAQGDVSANIEIETIKLLLQLLELPNDYFGGFVSGATMSNFTCLAVARQWLGKQLGKDIAKQGLSETIKILTATPHSSSLKALSLLGIGSNNIFEIKTLTGNREAIDIAEFEGEIIKLKGVPFILIASAGTVNSADFDDFEAIAKLREKHGFWWHIDAAFGGFAVCTDTHNHLVRGWEHADSVTVDCHKWLNVPYESAVFFVKEKYKVLQIETFQNSNAPYLGDPMEHFDYLNLLPENSRRLKALPVWFSLIAYGKQGIKDIVENGIRMAQLFGQFIEACEAFELLAPVRLNIVCFTLADKNEQEKLDQFLRKLNDTGQVFMTPTVYKGERGIRAAFVNWRTNIDDVNLVTTLMTKIIEDVELMKRAQ